MWCIINLLNITVSTKSHDDKRCTRWLWLHVCSYGSGTWSSGYTKVYNHKRFVPVQEHGCHWLCKQDEESGSQMISSHLTRRFSRASVLYVRMAEPLRTFENNRLSSSASSKNVGEINSFAKKCLTSVFEYSQARRIVLFNSYIRETALVLRDGRHVLAEKNAEK